MFTVNRLEVPPKLTRCLVTTNVIDSTYSGVRKRTDRVTNWQNGEMALRWAASAFVDTEHSYRKIMGYAQLWMLKTHLDETRDQENVVDKRKVG